MLLSEMFDRVLQWEWDDENDDSYIVASFYVDEDVVYNVAFEKDMTGSWIISFGRSERGGRDAPKNNITGTGQELAIFGTVIDIVRNFIADNDPDEMSFDAKKSEPSRVALYNRMLKMFPEDQWYTEVTELSNTIYYTIMTKEKYQHATQ